MSRTGRIVGAFACAIAAGVGASHGAARDTLLVVSASERFEVPVRSRGRGDWVPLRALGDKLRLTTRPDGGVLHLIRGDRELVVSERKNVATVAGQMTLLSSACTVEGNDWWVPADSLEALLGPLLQTPVRYRAGQRALVVGSPSIPRVVVTQVVSQDRVAVTLQASSPLSFRLSRPEGRIVVAFDESLVDVEIDGPSASAGILETLRLEQGTDPSVVMIFGPRFVDVRATEPEASRRLVLDFMGTPLEPGPVAPAGPMRPAGPGLRTIVIDPGHGGSDAGVSGAGGISEKAITLRFAQQLRASLMSNLGLQVLLTRDKDEDVDIDARVGVANNFKAQLFLSLHVNSRKDGGWPGPQVFSRSITEDLLPPTGPVVPGLDTWASAQAPHLEIATRVAAEVQTRLVQALGQGRPSPRSAALRVLAGASMPAILIELGCLDDAIDAARLSSDEGQRAIVSALVQVLSRYSPVEPTP